MIKWKRHVRMSQNKVASAQECLMFPLVPLHLTVAVGELTAASLLLGDRFIVVLSCIIRAAALHICMSAAASCFDKSFELQGSSAQLLANNTCSFKPHGALYWPGLHVLFMCCAVLFIAQAHLLSRVVNSGRMNVRK